jgi:hypothetical protein
MYNKNNIKTTIKTISRSEKKDKIFQIKKKKTEK